MIPHTRSNANTPRPAAATPSRVPTTPEDPAEPANVSSSPTTPVLTGPASSSGMTPSAPPSDGTSPNLATNPAELPSVPRKHVPSNPFAAAAAVAAAPAASSSCYRDREDPPGRVALQSAQGGQHQVILPSNFVPGNRPSFFKDLDAPQRRTSLPGGHLDHRARRTLRQATERQWTAPMPLNEYMALPRFDAGRYAAIPANHTVQVAGVRVSARSEAWLCRWLHCRHIQDVHDPCDLEFLRTSHEGLYQARLASLFRSISERGWQKDSTPKALHIELLCYGREAFHGLYWTKNRKLFGEDASSVSHILHRWLRPRYDWPCLTMFTWNATGSYFKVPFDLRFQYYPQGFPAWKDYETPEYLCVPTPAVYAYLGSHTCNTKPTAVDDIRIRFIHSIALTEFAAYALYSWLLATRDGIQFNCRSPDPRMYQQGYEMYPPGRLFFLPPALTSLIEGLGLNSLLAGSEFTMQDACACATAMASNSFLPSRDFAFFDWRSKRIVHPRPEHVSPLGGEYRLVPTFGKTHSPSGVAITSDIGEPSLPAPEPIAAPPALTSLPLPVHQPPASSAIPVAVSAPVTNPPAIPTASAPVTTASSATPAAPVASSPMPMVSAPVVVTSQPPTSTAMDTPAAASAPLPVFNAPPSVS